ncbi:MULTISPECIES: hypothetical protein [Shouchella]|uniref:Uncharacterized protein n=1 Tax=Shouchella hunanensis TaxID=766894 RepID=A0ABY7W589_9BACI|nr:MULTISPECIES: hypothetical protein [Shouchella]WDF02651.1 hypothetical protein PQ477_14135 [Shouchella hunanensis]
MFFWIMIMGLTCLNLNPVEWVRGMKQMPKQWLLSQVLRYGIGVVLSFVIIYILLVDHSLTGFLNSFGFIVALNLLVSGFFQAAKGLSTATKKKKVQKLKKGNVRLTQAGIGAVLFVGLLIMNIVYPLTITQQLSELGEIEISTDSIDSVTEESVRSVPHSYARYKSEIVFGNIENYSFYELGESAIQRIDGELYWVSPIEYSSVWRWLRADSAPGYVMVSAENPNAEAVLVDDYEMTYVPSAFLGENLERHIRSLYGDVILIDYSFEPDNDGNPYYAYSYAYYDHYRSAPKADGVILVDPVTGETQKYALGEQPDFIDNAIHYSLALDYAYWFGTYSNGLINSLFAKEGVHQPTSDEEMIGVLGPDGNMYWMIDHMRPNQESNAMVGFTMVNAQTGDATYYAGTSGMTNARGARDAVNRSFQREQWEGTQPVLYSIYDNYTWVVPVVDQSGLMREIAMVHADTSSVATGTSREEAFHHYRQMLANDLGTDDYIPTNLLDELEVEGTVYRVSQVSNSRFIQVLLEGESRVLEFDMTGNAAAVFIQPGDEIEVIVNDTGESVLPVIEFINLTTDEEFGEIEDFELEDENEQEVNEEGDVDSSDE